MRTPTNNQKKWGDWVLFLGLVRCISKLFLRYAIQRWYPEGRTKSTTYCWTDTNGIQTCAGGDTKGYNLAMVSKPFYNEPVIGPMLLPNHPPSMLVQSSFDSRYVAQKLANCAISFIDRNAHTKVRVTKYNMYSI